MKILIATDIHCGYGEHKKYLYEDSFETFEEVLQNAQRNQCDFILLGGDLYHENQPGRDTQLRVMRLIRQYCFNGPATQLKLSSHGDETFSHSHFKCANFEDQNLRVSTPIFTIHGNHDDLSGKGQTAVDILHESGLLNLFGKFENIKRFEVNPVLLEKDNSDGSVEKVAIYGISSQRDDRLARAFQDGNVIFNTPVDTDEWLNILVLHQNRPQRSTLRSTGSYIPTDLLPGFIDLVVWGHEHLSITEPERVKNVKKGHEFLLLQPGSTVATSLCPDEAAPKHCFLLDSSASLREPLIQPIPLETPRKIYFEEYDLGDLMLVPPCEKVRLKENMEDERFLHRKVKAILDRWEIEKNDVQPELPLIRIKVTYGGQWKNIPPVNPKKFGAHYVDKVANPAEMIMVKTCRSSTRFVPGDSKIPQQEQTVNVEDLVKGHFRSAVGESKLAIFNTEVLNHALKDYGAVTTTFTQVDKQFGQTLKDYIKNVNQKLFQLTGQTDDCNERESYKDFEERVGKCIYAHFFEDDELMDHSDTKENAGMNDEDGIQWLGSTKDSP